jgi:hypothetical protein
VAREWLECGEFNRRNTANHKEPIGRTIFASENENVQQQIGLIPSL